jgi:molybdopterin converting factor small subunit
MGVVVEGSGAFAEFIPPGYVLENVKTVGDVVERLKLPSHSGMIVLVNHQLASWGTELKSGDIVNLIPAIGGGTTGSPLARPVLA